MTAVQNACDERSQMYCSKFMDCILEFCSNQHIKLAAIAQ